MAVGSGDAQQFLKQTPAGPSGPNRGRSKHSAAKLGLPVKRKPRTRAYFPAERIGAVVLTNGQQTGVAEAMIETLYDDLFHGGQAQDWVAVIGKYFEDMMSPTPKKDFDQRPHDAVDPGSDERYPPKPYDGDEMWWQFAGENAGPPAAAFRGGTGGRAERLTLDILDDEGARDLHRELNATLRLIGPSLRQGWSSALRAAWDTPRRRCAHRGAGRSRFAEGAIDDEVGVPGPAVVTGGEGQ